MATAYYTATSLDGFIADENHSLSWLLSQPIDQDGPMHYSGFIKQIGALVMGASTYLWVKENDVDKGNPWSYQQPTWVMTHRDLPKIEGANIVFAQGDVRSVYAAAKAAAGDKDIWLVGGGELVGQFADAGLLDEVWVQYAPVTLGRGAPILPRRLSLELLEMARNGAFLCGRYRVIGALAPDGPTVPLPASSN
jgi:dihydrofolate reductase